MKNEIANGDILKGLLIVLLPIMVSNVLQTVVKASGSLFYGATRIPMTSSFIALNLLRILLAFAIPS
jgi:hypothetical protein